MASTRKTILETIRTTLAQGGVDADRIKTEQQMPSDRGGVLVNVIPGQDQGTKIGEGMVSRQLLVSIAAIVPIDGSDRATAFEQATDTWEKLEPQIEKLFTGQTNIHFMEEASGGVQWLTLDDRQGTYAVVGCDYTIEYERNLQST